MFSKKIKEIAYSKNNFLNYRTLQELKADHAIVAVGIEPETLLAKESNLEIDQELGGYKVNEELEARLVFEYMLFPPKKYSML